MTCSPPASGRSRPPRPDRWSARTSAGRPRWSARTSSGSVPASTRPRPCRSFASGSARATPGSGSAGRVRTASAWRRQPRTSPSRAPRIGRRCARCRSGCRSRRSRRCTGYRCRPGRGRCRPRPTAGSCSRQHPTASNGPRARWSARATPRSAVLWSASSAQSVPSGWAAACRRKRLRPREPRPEW